MLDGGHAGGQQSAPTHTLAMHFLTTTIGKCAGLTCWAISTAQQSQCTRTANTYTNILKLRPALWTFTTNSALEPTNNAAGHALRCIVLMRKILEPTRSLRGDELLSRGFSVHETCLRQGVDLWDVVHKAVVA